MNIPNFSNADGTSKSFWERPEGNWGLAVLAALGLVGFFTLKSILPALISFMDLAITAIGKGFVLAGLCAGVALLYAVVANGTVQAVTSFAFKGAVRSFANWFVTIDPIGIMKDYVSYLTVQLGKIDSGIEKLNGQMTICRRKIDANAKGAEQALLTMKVAKEQGKKVAATVNSRQHGRLEQSNVTLTGLLSTMELHMRAMRTYRDVSESIILDMRNEVDLREDERKLILASYSVMQSAKRILNGDPDKKELFDRAMDFVIDDYGQKLGAIENFIQTSQSFVEGLDLQNGVYEAEALAKIEAWENKADSILLGDTKKQMVETHRLNIIPEQMVSTQAQDSEYMKYFGKK